MNKTFKKYLITAIVGLAISLIVLIYEIQIIDFSEHFIRIFCDSFFIAGILMFCAALIGFASNGGGFDAFAYLAHRARYKTSRRRRKEGELLSYYDFVTERREKDKLSVVNIFIVSAAFLAIAIILVFIN